MAALSSFISTTQSLTPSLKFHPFNYSNPNLPISSPNFSGNPTLRIFKNGRLQLQVKERRFSVVVRAAEGDIVEKKSEISSGNDNPQGPPIATILAGFVVFGVVFWFIGSILSWLVGLIVNVPPLK